MQSVSLPCPPTTQGHSPFTTEDHKAKALSTLFFLSQRAENPSSVYVCIYSHTENTGILSMQLDELSQSEHM